jgi:hypothetical protein
LSARVIVASPVAAEAGATDGAATDGAATEGAATDGATEGATVALPPPLVQAARRATTARLRNNDRVMDGIP